MPIMINLLFVLAGIAAVAFGIVIAFNIRGVVTRKVARNYKKLELIHQANGRMGPVFVPIFGTAGYLRFLGVVLIPAGLIMTLAGSVLLSHHV